MKMDYNNINNDSMEDDSKEPEKNVINLKKIKKDLEDLNLFTFRKF